MWINSNETSVVTTLAVADKRMLTDSERVGKVKWMDEKKKPPKGGWSVHDARVLYVSGKCLFLVFVCGLVLTLCGLALRSTSRTSLGRKRPSVLGATIYNHRHAYSSETEDI